MNLPNNIILTIGKEEEHEEHSNAIYSNRINYIEYVCEAPNDEKYVSSDQWAIDKIALPAAWNETTGSSTVYVGVIDTGIDASHPDLQNRVNTELSRCFTPHFDTALEDDYGHGTQVAGIIGAEGDNTIGVTGTCWNVQLVSLRVASKTGGFVVAAVIDAIEYADSVGIQILNYSGGGYNYTTDAAHRQVAIQQYSGLFVCSAGNDNKDNDVFSYYPSDHNYFSNVISVGASDPNDERWYDHPGDDGGSNYGQNKVDLFAPGEDVYTTRAGGTYGTSSGTSMAAPHVTGVAALILSKHPTMDAAHIKFAIIEHVDDVRDSNNNSVFENYCKSGGRLNAYNALTSIQQGHVFAYSSLGNEYHSAICKVCNYSTSFSHSIHHNNQGADVGHMPECTICDYTGETDPHMFRYVNDGLSAGHTATCIGCGYSFSEFHTWVTVGAKYRCSDCGITSTQVPVLPFTLPPEILAKIEQMGIGAFAMDIGDGTVLCRIDDQYYLVRGQTVDTALSHLSSDPLVITSNSETD